MALAANPVNITEVAVAVIFNADGAFLLGRRNAHTVYAGYWEFPGGKVEAGENPEQALRRELHEELAITVERMTPWLVREHVYEHAHVRLYFFRVSHWQGQIQPKIHDALHWQQPHDLKTSAVAPMLPANAGVFAALQLPTFYAITHAWQIGIDAQLQSLDIALAKGCRLLQVREAALSQSQRESFCAAALARCQAYGAKMLVNDDVQLACDIGADGVHLPAARLMQLNARPALPLVAASCHDAAELDRAARLGLDFAVLGPLKATASHPEQAGIGWSQFQQLIAQLPLPVYAIGGLGAADIATAQQAGAQGIAAIRAAWTARSRR